MVGSSPKAFSHVIDFEQQNGTISLWFKDNKQETVDAALREAKKAIDIVGADHKEFTIRLGSGTIALQYAMNHVVERYHYLIIALLNLVILAGCSLAYRSVVAGLISHVPGGVGVFEGSLSALLGGLPAAPLAAAATNSG